MFISLVNCHYSSKYFAQGQKKRSQKKIPDDIEDGHTCSECIPKQSLFNIQNIKPTT